MTAASLSPAQIYAVMDANPAASLRASADAFEAMGKTFDAEFTRGMVKAAEICPPLYAHWSRQQAERVRNLREQAA